MKNQITLDCQNINFSQHNSERRITWACNIVGAKIVYRIICYALYLLGASRLSLSSILKMPPDTIKSLIKRIQQYGISAFEDRRSKEPSIISISQTKSSKASVTIEGQWVTINCGTENQAFRIAAKNSLQVKVILLSMYSEGLLSLEEISKALDLSASHISKLTRQLQASDVESLLDRRKGQQQEFLFTPEIKAELIQQFVLDTVSYGKASGEAITDHLQSRCNIKLSPRSIRYHMEKLGLSNIKKSLPELLERVKKKSIKSF